MSDDQVFPSEPIVPLDKIPDCLPELKQAFTEWWNQGSDRPPTNGDIVKFDKIDVDILHHLSLFIWNRAKKHG